MGDKSLLSSKWSMMAYDVFITWPGSSCLNEVNSSSLEEDSEPINQ